MEAENFRPTATLARGGTPPDFVTEHQQLHMWEWGNANITYRTFHILDAIEYEVMRANTMRDLQRILKRYMPEIAPNQDVPIPRGPMVPLIWPYEMPAGLDDDGSIRLQTFWDALDERNRRVAATTSTREAREAAQQVCEMPVSPPRPDVDLDYAYAQCNERGCLLESVGQQFGRYPCHADYARAVSGVSREVRVETPEGLSRDFDALGADGTLYEVKTGYRFMLNTSPSTQLQRERVLFSWIDQSQTQQAIAARCGYRLEWHFNERAVAEFADGLLAVPVSHTPFSCDVDSDE